MNRKLTLNDDLCGRLVAQLRQNVERLDTDLRRLSVGSARRAAKQAQYDQAHSDYLALCSAVMAGERVEPRLPSGVRMSVAAGLR